MSKVDNFSIKQQIQLAEACTGGCCEMQNKYDVIDMANGNKLFEIQEKSPNCERCFCAPYHGLFLEWKGAR